MGELQEWSDGRSDDNDKRRRCPATGTTVWEAWCVERALLSPLDHLPEPFDIEVRRPVAIDCLVSFERRRYSVPFQLVGMDVRVRGCARTVQIIHAGVVVAEHERRGAGDMAIEPSHFEGTNTNAILAPVPLGRVGRLFNEIARTEEHARSIDVYRRLVEAQQ